jgi:predicted DNA-binding transcriptional regulator AlpA
MPTSGSGEQHGPEERLVPADEFARRLSIKRRTLGRRLRESAVPQPIRLRGRLFWRQSVVETFIRQLQQ